MKKNKQIIFFYLYFSLNIALGTTLKEEIPLWQRSQFEQLKVAETKLKEAEQQIHNDSTKSPLSYLSSPLQRLGTLRTFVGDAFGVIHTRRDIRGYRYWQS